MKIENNTNSKAKKRLKLILVTVAIVLVLLVSIGILVVNHMIYGYTDPWNKKVTDAGFVEKTVQIGQVKLNYVEGPDNGPELLLLHAQHMEWFSYSRTLPELSRSFHVFAVDYHGHGKTKCPVEYYTANKIGHDLATFMDNVIKEPAYVTGNSSGGILTAWLAANKPELVKAIVLEDPPLFTSEYPRIKRTISYVSFTSCNDYIKSGKGDFLIYWLRSHSSFVAKSAGEDKVSKLLSFIQTYRKKNPGKPVEVRFLPDYFRIFIRGLANYDPHFGAAFYDGSWNDQFDHAKMLQRIKCPTLLLHANFHIRDDGVLMGAMNQDDADRAVSLIPNAKYKRVDSAHTVHLDKPEQFIQLVEAFFLEK
jgi:pimeloyl-ACP methyl ester carboxylesterase